MILFGTILAISFIQSCGCDEDPPGGIEVHRRDIGDWPFCEGDDCLDDGGEEDVDDISDTDDDNDDDDNDAGDGGDEDVGNDDVDGGEEDAGPKCPDTCPEGWVCNPETGNCEVEDIPQNQPPVVEFTDDVKVIPGDVPVGIKSLIKRLEDPDGYIVVCFMAAYPEEYLQPNEVFLESTLFIPAGKVAMLALKCLDNAEAWGEDGILLGGEDTCVTQNIVCEENAECFGGECICLPEWSVPPECLAQNPCFSITCPNGYCDEADGQCVCPGWIAPECVFPDENTADPCNRNGKLQADGSCECNPGWLWPDCAQWDKEPIYFCSGHGFLKPDLTCECNPGWDGDECQNPTGEDPCGGHGAWWDETCFCWFGYSGDECERCVEGYKEENGECSPQPCPSYCINGECQEDGTCLCDDSHDGIFCDRCKIGYEEPDCTSCSPGYEGPDCTPDKCFGKTCEDGLWCNGVATCNKATGECEDGPLPCSDDEICLEERQICVECVEDEDCEQDAVFCNGPELCLENICQHAGDPCTKDNKICVEDGDACVECVKDADCEQDGLFCNGPEVCQAYTCQSKGNPCVAPKKCDEENDKCVDCLTDTDCSQDFIFCNGPEICLKGACAHQGDPCDPEKCKELTDQCVECLSDSDCPNDDDVCNGTEACDLVTNSCVHLNPLQCDNGNPCDGAETCDPVTGCVAGTPIVCPSDGDVCDGSEQCDPATGQCKSFGPLNCQNSSACDGVETCDPILGCQAGTPVSCGTNQHCEEPSGACVCDSGWGPPGECDKQCDPNPDCIASALVVCWGGCHPNTAYSLQVKATYSSSIHAVETQNCGSPGTWTSGDTITVPWSSTQDTFSISFKTGNCTGDIKLKATCRNACGEEFPSELTVRIQ
ncbi:hypothetical protein JXA05_04060 [Candidatus Peregrinibacteria bacterium]|nr:hypothetical protein [Candidatus Peregrinibacteria bacterium]